MERWCSTFSQLLPLVSKSDFRRAVRETGAERHARGFSCWDQFVAMLFCHLARAHSLREICGGLATCEGKLGQLGVQGVPKRSTLAYANRHRPWKLYEMVFHSMLAQFQSERLGRHKFRFKNKLVSLDATVVELCVEVFDWAHFRQTKGAVKLHMQLDHDGYLPSFALITTGREHEVKVARRLSFQEGTIVVFDRGFVDYGWFDDLTSKGVFFVTRLKQNAVFEILKERVVPQHRNIISDQEIRIGKAGAGHGVLRLVTAIDPETEKIYQFLTNHLTLGASTIAAIYKERWQIEIFFKAIKQNLKIKTFLGTSSNAVYTQIWTALIAMLLLRYLQLKARHPWSLSNLLALLRMNLFVYRNLWKWLDDPFTAPPPPTEVQLSLAFG